MRKRKYTPRPLHHSEVLAIELLAQNPLGPEYVAITRERILNIPAGGLVQDPAWKLARYRNRRRRK